MEKPRTTFKRFTQAQLARKPRLSITSIHYWEQSPLLQSFSARPSRPQLVDSFGNDNDFQSQTPITLWALPHSQKFLEKRSTTNERSTFSRCLKLHVVPAKSITPGTIRSIGLVSGGRSNK